MQNLKKIQSNIFYLKQLSILLLVIYFMFFLTRIGFYFYNKDFFTDIPTWDIVEMFFYALRLDTVSIFYINILLILSFLVPFKIRKHSKYRVFQKILYIFFNTAALIFETTDIFYYKYSFRRLNISDFKLFWNSRGMASSFIFQIVLGVLLIALTAFLLNFIYNKVIKKDAPVKENLFPQVLFFIIGVGLTLVGIRGGVQLRPVIPLTAVLYAKDISYVPLLSNASLSLIFSFQQKFIRKVNYFPENEVKKYFNTIRKGDANSTFKKENIVIIILESFGKEYIDFFQNEKKGITPFLDSLLCEGLTFKNSYANGLRSTFGIVSITSSLPGLMDEPIMFSPYQSNKLDGIAGILSKKGYTTGFFHGSNPGSMEFEKFAKLTGFQNFYDKRAFDNEEFYDGSWGIWDVPFFQFFANTLNSYDQPFVGTIFSLTSHHPYHVEKYFAERYPDEKPIFRSIRYTDYALKKFFESASKMPWFDNTLFVITADHVGRSFQKKYKTKRGKYEVPILFYKPGTTFSGIDTTVVQQIDIMPTVLDYLKYPNDYNAFGESAFDKDTEHFAYMYENGVYQILNNKYILLFNTEKTTGLFDFTKDPFMKHDLKDKKEKIKIQLENKLKAIIQVHNEKMIDNGLY